nr:hypothetical protein Iba_chr13bCG8250 [Ipomoea batatas]
MKVYEINGLERSQVDVHYDRAVVEVGRYFLECDSTPELVDESFHVNMGRFLNKIVDLGGLGEIASLLGERSQRMTIQGSCLSELIASSSTQVVTILVMLISSNVRIPVTSLFSHSRLMEHTYGMSVDMAEEDMLCVVFATRSCNAFR